MQTELFGRAVPTDITENIFQAYFDCRKNKRNTINALAFEKHFEHNLFRLVEDIESGQYDPGRSIAFIVNRPVKREIFAADFRDRVVHHFLVNKLNPLFEKVFIYDSYACRINKGTHFGIQRVNKFIKQCSNDYSADCYILKLDIQGFFMHIHKGLLFRRLKLFIDENYDEDDKLLVIELCRKIVFNDPTKNCIIKGNKKDWEGLPHNKSLFFSPPNCGLPIGNLTSQIFANFYLNSFDHYMKQDIELQFYGRYVDDFVIIHPDKVYLKSLIPLVYDYLKTKLYLTLHPNKIYLQHYIKGVQFLGTIIKPGRIYIANRTKGNFYTTIEMFNKKIRHRKADSEALEKFQSSMNSYLGIMKHYCTYKIRKRLIDKHLSAWWWNHFYVSGGYSRFKRKLRKKGKCLI